MSDEFYVYECERGHRVASGDEPCYMTGDEQPRCMAPVFKVTFREVARERVSGDPMSPVYFDDDGKPYPETPLRGQDAT